MLSANSVATPSLKTRTRAPSRLTELGNKVGFHGFDGGRDMPTDITAEALEHFLAGREERELLDPLPEPDCK